MAIFEIEKNGQTFEIEAPDQAAAVSAFQQYAGAGEPAGNASRSAPPQAISGAQMAQEQNLPIPGTPMTVPKPAEPSMVPWLDPVSAFANSAVDAIPVYGPTLTNMGQNLDAITNSIVTGQPYDPQKSWEERVGINGDLASQYPEASTAGSIAGSVAPLIGIGMTPTGGKAMGMTGPLWQRMALGTLSSGVVSGGDALARGDDIPAAAAKMLGGAAIGGAFPLAERAVGAVARALMGQKGNAAASVLSKGMQRDRVNPAVARAMLDQLGPNAVLADLGPNMTRQAAALASMPGEAQTVVRDALMQRHLGTNARIQGDVNSILGPAPVPSAVEAGIAANREALSPEYKALFAGNGVRAVDTTPLAHELESMMVSERGASADVASTVRRMLNLHGESGMLDPSPETLFATRKAVGGMLAKAQSAIEKDPTHIGALKHIYGQIDQMLTDAVPGIKRVDAQYQELAQQSTGLVDGQAALDSGRTAVRPQELAAQMAAPDASPLFVGPSGVPFRLSQGARADIDRLIGTTGNNVTALKSALKGDGSWNRERLVSLFGAEKADGLLSVLEREMAYQRPFNAVVQNSETAARSAAQKDIAPMQFGERPTNLVDLLLRAPQAVANAAARTRSESANRLVAEALMSRPSPELVDQIIAQRARASRPALVAPAAGAALLTNR